MKISPFLFIGILPVSEFSPREGTLPFGESEILSQYVINLAMHGRKVEDDFTPNPWIA